MENLVMNLSAVRTTMYIDPAATTVLISSISAIAVAAGASAIIIWRKLKKKASKVLHIDENANKEVEEDIQVFDDDDDDE